MKYLTFSGLSAAVLLLCSAATAQNEILPDLIGSQSAMTDWTLDTNTEPGRVLLRFTSSIPNVGLGEFVLMATGESAGNGRIEVNQRIFRDDDTFYEIDAGTFKFNPSINMMEADGWVDYRLRRRLANNEVGEVVRNGAKPAVCIQSTTIFDSSIPNVPSVRDAQRGCDEDMGISVGWTDIYPRFLDFQWVDITGVANGDYWLEMAVDPGDNVVESDDTNNVSRVAITLDSPFLIGAEDVNGDEALDAQDIQLVVNGALGLDVGQQDVDVNDDGIIDAVDIQRVINAVLMTPS